MPRKKKTDSIAAEVIAADTPPAPRRGPRYKPRYKTTETLGPIAGQLKGQKAGKRTELQKLTTDGDLVDIWERRLLNPDYQESVPIRIKTPGMEIRWINLSNRGRFQRARYEQGWVPVKKDELVDEREIYGVTYTAEEFVCRGEKQTEMLMKIPKAVYKQIQRRRGELNAQSYKKLRQTMGSAGHQHFKERYGGSAGDVAEEAANSFVGSIKFGTERASSDELFE